MVAEGKPRKRCATNPLRGDPETARLAEGKGGQHTLGLTDSASTGGDDSRCLALGEVGNDRQRVLELIWQRKDGAKDVLRSFLQRKDGGKDVLRRFLQRKDGGKDVLRRFLQRKDDGKDVLRRFLQRKDGAKDVLRRFLQHKDGARHVLELSLQLQHEFGAVGAVIFRDGS